jgi:hypothetical protein
MKTGWMGSLSTKVLLALLAAPTLATPNIAQASALDFKSIHCVDANSAAHSPIVFDVANDVEDSDTGTRFNLNQAGTNGAGDIVMTILQNQVLSLSGTSDARLLVQLPNGQAKFSGQVFGSPADGSNQVRSVQDYALNCLLTY